MTASDKPLWSQKGCMNFLSVRSWFLVMSFVVHVSLVFGSFRFTMQIHSPSNPQHLVQKFGAFSYAHPLK